MLGHGCRGEGRDCGHCVNGTGQRIKGEVACFGGLSANQNLCMDYGGGADH